MYKLVIYASDLDRTLIYSGRFIRSRGRLVESSIQVDRDIYMRKEVEQRYQVLITSCSYQ